MPERIEYSTHSPAMLEIDRRLLSGSGLDRLRVNGVRVIHNEKHSPGSCADRAGHNALRTLAYRSNPECCLADRQLCDDLFAIAHHVEHAGAESSLIERDCGRPLVDPELGLYRRHDIRVFTLEQAEPRPRSAGAAVPDQGVPLSSRVVAGRIPSRG